MKKHLVLIGAFSTISLLSGCATITKDANQSVQIETYTADNTPIKGVKCTARNDRGEWSTYTPGTVSVHRSGENLQVSCAIENNPDGRGTLISRANGGMYGNILIGGGIGAIIDHNKGTAYTYPSWVKVMMGQNLVFDRKHEVENQILTGQNASGSSNELAIAAKTDTVK